MQMLGNLGQNKTYLLHFLPPSLFKKRFRATAASKYFRENAFPVCYVSSLWVLFLFNANKNIKKNYAAALRRRLSQLFETIVP